LKHLQGQSDVLANDGEEATQAVGKGDGDVILILQEEIHSICIIRYGPIQMINWQSKAEKDQKMVELVDQKMVELIEEKYLSMFASWSLPKPKVWTEQGRSLPILARIPSVDVTP